jgi:hypothetical protein
LTARRLGDEVQVRFTVPNENTDLTTPVALARVEIYASAGPVTQTAPVPMSIPAMPYSVPIDGVPVPVTSTPILISRVPPVQLWVPPEFVKPRGDKPREAATMVLTEPGAGSDVGAGTTKATHVAGDEYRLEPEPPRPRTIRDRRLARHDLHRTGHRRPDGGRQKRRCLGVRMSSWASRPVNGPGAPSPVLEVPLTVDVAPPRDPAVTYDETTVKLTWTPAGPEQLFRVYRPTTTARKTVP